MGNEIEGVLVTSLKQIKHPKGDVFHALKCTEESFKGFGEAYFSSILEGNIKAWKCHSSMTLNLVCIVGKIHFVLYDGRKESTTYGQFEELTLSPDLEDNYVRLTVPPKVWMAFVGVGEKKSILLNVADIPHDPTEQVNIPIKESGIIFDFNNINVK